jgi:hypothetical protein
MTTKTTLHDLHADVLLCIFEYFTVNELYETFPEAIPYLTSLLINSHVRLHLRKSILTEIDPAQIVSIDLTCLSRLSSPTISDFINLRSLILHDMEDPKILINQPLSQSLEVLHLNISLRNKSEIIPGLLQLLTQLPKLKSYTLMYPSSYFILQPDLLIFPTLSTTIINVKLDVKCSINYLELLLLHLPCLRRFQSMIGTNSENLTESAQNSLFSSIESLFLTWEYIPFRNIITFCKKMPNLKNCQFISTDYRYEADVFNSMTWRQFIESDHVLLKKLIVHMKPTPQYGDPRIQHRVMRDRYFRSINFKFKPDYRYNIILEGNYVKAIE